MYTEKIQMSITGHSDVHPDIEMSITNHLNIHHGH
jgi:hypothetical protein